MPTSCAPSSSHGVKIGLPPQDGPFGRMFSFVDPGGNVLTVHGG